MTVTDKPSDQGSDVAKREDLLTVTIDDVEVSVPKGTLLIRAAEMIGVAIPRSATTRCWTRWAPAGSAWWRSPMPATAAGCPSRRPPAPSRSPTG